jgi:hypothetical protein
MGLQPLPQQLLQLLLEAVGAGERLKRCLELSLLRLEPLAPERFEIETLHSHIRHPRPRT